jgi:hypothetical protein
MIEPTETNLLRIDGGDLRVEWFRGWDAQLDDVLRALPETADCPLSLLRLLIQNELPEPKRVAVAFHGDDPIALIPIRDTQEPWQIVTNWITPGHPFPAAPGLHVPALAAVRHDIYVSWWQCEDVPVHARLQDVSILPTRRADLEGDFEGYWKKSGQLRSIRRARERCEGLRLEQNLPGAAEATIRQWERTWREAPEIEWPSLQDRLIASEHLAALGREYCFSLHDGDVLVAGMTFLVHGAGLVFHVPYRHRDYDSAGVGVRLLDHASHWGAENGFAFLDFGGTDFGAYKARWGPDGGTKASFQLRAPESHAKRIARRLKRRLRPPRAPA